MGGKPEAWKTVLKKLKLKKYRVIYSENQCPWGVREFKYDMWFPTSSELRDIFGLNFEGAICSDNYDCYSIRISQIYPKGAKVIVGNKEFTVN